MCVICVKKKGLPFPKKEYLKNCFEGNPDGAGFMYPFDGKVRIQKGFDTFDKFWRALDRARGFAGDNLPYVMHFRIATQGFDLDMTHPFPLTKDFAAMKKRKIDCDVGVAHNGIIQHCSDGSKDYSDTALFIKKYLTAIIRNFKWHKDEGVKDLIEILITGSRLSVMDKYGHTNEYGEGWIEEDGILYSNSSYKHSFRSFRDVLNHSEEEWSLYKMQNSDEYGFDETWCPLSVEGDPGYCGVCANRGFCGFGMSEFDKVYDRGGRI